MATTDLATRTRQVCTFALGDLLLGVPVESVQEVLRHQELTRIPLAPPAVRGLVNLRGQIVSAFDLRELLGIGGKGIAEPMNVVLCDDGGGGLSLLVDEIGDVLTIEESRVEPPPETLTGTLRTVVSAVVKLEKRLLVLFDARRAVQLGTAGLDAASARRG